MEEADVMSGCTLVVGISGPASGNPAAEWAAERAAGSTEPVEQATGDSACAFLLPLARPRPHRWLRSVPEALLRSGPRCPVALVR
jgi:hypothetical protein